MWSCASPVAVMKCNGFCRIPPPVCGPSSSNGMPRSNTLPVRTRRAAATKRSGVIRLVVPRSSSAPQRPQLLSRSPTARKSSIRARYPGANRRHQTAYTRFADASLMAEESTHGDDAEGAAHEGVHAAEVGVRADRADRRVCSTCRSPPWARPRRRVGRSRTRCCRRRSGRRRRSSRCTAPCTR